jgi:hypothetical protein
MFRVLTAPTIPHMGLTFGCFGAAMLSTTEWRELSFHAYFWHIRSSTDICEINSLLVAHMWN